MTDFLTIVIYTLPVLDVVYVWSVVSLICTVIGIWLVLSDRKEMMLV